MSSNRTIRAAGAAFVALLALGCYAAPAAARWGDQDDHRNEWRNERNGHRQDWNRGHYQAPPVVYERYYSAPTYYAPPVVYGPSYDSGFGLNINIR
jgi:hypothetical protein